MTTLPENHEKHYCPHCGAECEEWLQEGMRGRLIPQIHCANRDCDLDHITLDLEQWMANTEEQWQAYAVSMANVRRVQGAA